MTAEDRSPIKINVKADTKDAIRVIEKIIDTIKAPFSWWATTREPVTQAKAEVDATLIRAKAIDPLAEALGITREEAVTLVLRSEQREVFDRIRHQTNIESIVQGAVELATSSVSAQPVDLDWTTDFLDSCKNISDKDMQTLWSRILAGEVSQPGSFPKRTVAFVKTLAKSEAHLFTRFCSFLWHIISDNTYAHFRTQDDKMIREAGFDIKELFELDALGLITFSEDTYCSFDAASEVPLISYFGEQYYLYPKEKEGLFSFKAFSLTKLGESLVSISGAQGNENYKTAVIDIVGNHFTIDHRPPGQ